MRSGLPFSLRGDTFSARRQTDEDAKKYFLMGRGDLSGASILDIPFNNFGTVGLGLLFSPFRNANNLRRIQAGLSNTRDGVVVLKTNLINKLLFKGGVCFTNINKIKKIKIKIKIKNKI